jgi:hypothetical protein
LNNLFSPYHFKEDLTLGKGRTFIEKTQEIFRVQSSYNPVYATYLKCLAIDSTKVSTLYQIPCLPISFFKSHAIKTGDFEPEVFFESSGTTSECRTEFQRVLWGTPQLLLSGFVAFLFGKGEFFFGCHGR